MNCDYRLFKFEKGILAYKKAGNGKRILFTFHGHGQDHSVFTTLVEELGNRFTVYSFDLFFHGKSKWRDGNPISKSEWEALLGDFLTQEKVNRFSLLGFSLGAKLALATLESYESRIDSIYLIAPEGIKRNIWYSIATSAIGKNFFRSLIKKPSRFHTILSRAKTLKLVDESLLRFARTQMESEQQRRLVYNSWIVFSELKFNLSHIASLISNPSIETIIVLGSRDKIITPTDMKKLTAMAKEIRIEVVQAGHTNVLDRSIEVLKKIN